MRPIAAATVVYASDSGSSGTVREHWTFPADGAQHGEVEFPGQTDANDEVLLFHTWTTIQDGDPTRFATYRFFLGDQPVESIRLSKGGADSDELANIQRVSEAAICQYVSSFGGPKISRPDCTTDLPILGRAGPMPTCRSMSRRGEFIGQHPTR